MHTVCWVAASLLGTAAGYLLHSVRVRMMSARERKELAALKVKLEETMHVVDSVAALIARREKRHPPA